MSRYKPRMDLNKQQIDALYEGSVDMHIHCAPDPVRNRRANTYEIAKAAAEGGMRAVVVKSFYYPTTTEAQIAEELAEGVRVFGSVTISYGTTGGLTYAAQTIENHAKMGCKVVWFPAFDAAYCRKGIGQSGGIDILEPDGHLKREVEAVLEIIKNMIWCFARGTCPLRKPKRCFPAPKNLAFPNWSRRTRCRTPGADLRMRRF